MIMELLIAASVAPGSTRPILPRELASAAQAYDIAQITGDRASLSRYLADDYLLVNGAGETETKAQLIADFTDPHFKLNPYHVEKPSYRLWPGGALLAGEVFLTGISGTKLFSAHTRFVDVWRLRSGRWQVVYTQVTRFPASH